MPGILVINRFLIQRIEKKELVVERHATTGKEKGKRRRVTI